MGTLASRNAEERSKLVRITEYFGFFAFCLGQSRGERIVRWLFLAAAISAIVSFIGMSLYFGLNLEYLFEVTIISMVWLTLIVSGALQAFAFARFPDGRGSVGSDSPRARKR